MQETVTIGNKQYTLQDPGHLALMKAAKEFIVQDRPNPLEEGVKLIVNLPSDIPPAKRMAMIEEIRGLACAAMLDRNRVTAEDIGAFLQTREGLIFAFWQFCREIELFEHAVPVVEAMMAEAGEELAAQVLQAKIDTAAGMAEAKNSSGPDPKPKGPGDQADNSSLRATPNSTSTSRPSTDSPISTLTDFPLSPLPPTSGR